MKNEHKALVKVAVDWLRRSPRCGVILWEASTTGGGEEPDAIGWRMNGIISHLVEVKVSRADFLADRDKMFRRVPSIGVGRYRWMLVPDQLVRPDEVPEGWGLVYHVGHTGRTRVMRKADEQTEYNHHHELQLLYNGLRRHRANVAAINAFIAGMWPLRGEMPEIDDADDAPVEADGDAIPPITSIEPHVERRTDSSV